MKKTIQIQILELLRYFAVYSPYSEKNNKDYKLLGGHFDKLNQRWLVPNGAGAQFRIAELFGEASPSVIACITGKDLVAFGNQLQYGGYLAASWDERKNLVWLPEGVDLIKGGWNVAASTAGKTPCLADPDAVLHIVVRRAFAEKHGLKIVEELPEEPITNPLARYANSDLQTELEDRGYRVVAPSSF